MRYLKVRRSGPIRGEISMPPSKAHSFRALILAALADGTSMIRRPKISSDWHEAVKAMRLYGAEIQEIEPEVLLLLDYWPLERVESVREVKVIGKLILEKLPLFALTIALSIMTFSAQKNAITYTDIFTLRARVANAIIAYAKYIYKTIWPIKLGILYPLDMGVAGWEVFPGVAVLTGATIVVVLLWKRKYLTVGWMWYIGTLVPVIGLVQVGLQGMADRCTYIPMVGLGIMLAWGAEGVVTGISLP